MSRPRSGPGRRVGRRHRGHRGPVRTSARLGLVSVFVLGVLGTLTPAASAVGQTPSPSPSPTAASPDGAAPSPQAGVPLTTMAPQTSNRITLVLFDEDIVLVGGRNFTPSNDVTVAAQTADLGGSALIKADGDGRFILGFRVPADFKGAVNIRATQGGASVADSLDVTGPEAAAQEYKAAPPLPDLPVGSPTTAGSGAVPQTSPSPTTGSGVSTTPFPTPTSLSPTAAPTTPLTPTATPRRRGGTSASPAATPTTVAPLPSVTGSSATPATPTAPAARPAPAPGGTADIDAGGPQSGLPWMSGFQSHQLAQLTDFGNWRGRPNDVVHVYTDRTSGWGGLVQPTWPVDLFKGFPGKLVISQPTYPKSGGSNGECARGAYDEQWKKLGSFLVAHGRADSIVRIGWEFNGTFMYWHSDADPTVFKTCFQKIATAIRSTDPQVLIDWTFNAHNSPVPSGNSPWGAYPGDEYVDYVGIDSYDHYPPSKDDATWNKQCEDVNGLCYVIRFAREHGKKVGVGEWGVASCSGDGGGDNPFYMKKMFETFKAAGDVMGYDAYFSDPTPGNVCSTITNGGQNPKAAAVYKELFGKG
ncbi:glycosyl hydrolase [Frankia sp. AgKG'84/4]|uniref:glycosyl hydrolase n=1 Tax=Frankia sp. AgKG'84/4 TaxID=573490 RepID=UPI0027E435F9|nr:glycosyl hydrolase [Frankia sp. AgKG'84/4]